MCGSKAFDGCRQKGDGEPLYVDQIDSFLGASSCFDRSIWGFFNMGDPQNHRFSY